MNKSSHCFQLSPLIRGTLLTVYLALVLPLPALAPESLRLWLLAAVPFGLLVVLAMLSEQVTVTSSGSRSDIRPGVVGCYVEGGAWNGPR